MNVLDRIELQEVEELEKESFKINDMNGATWAFRKLQALNKKEMEINDIAQVEIDRIDAWKDRELKSIEGDMAYFQSLLEGYYREQREADPKFKCSTPYGKVSSRKTKTWTYDDAQVMAYIEENGLSDLVRVKKELDKATIKKTFKVADNGTVVAPDTGEVVDGIRVAEVESVSVTVEV